MSCFRPLLIGAGAMLLLSAPAIANDRLMATQLLKTSLECPIGIEKTKSSGVLYVLKTRNKFLGDEKSFILLESYDGAELSFGENYTRAGTYRVSVKFSNINTAKTSGSKVTIACKAGSRCLTVRYEMTDAGHDSEWEDYTDKKSSYRISTCGASSAKDVADTINFLAQ